MCIITTSVWHREKSEVEMSMQEVQDDRQQLAENLEQTTSQLEALQV